jgi:hypothetical protein
VKYGRGFLYFDKCGSLMLALQDAFGEPTFQGAVPNMLFGELKNDAERIVVRYSPDSFSFNQSWMPSLARFEQLAPGGWHEVSEALGVAKRVTHFGVRFWLLWKTDSAEESRRIVEAAKLVLPSDEWRELFGDAPIHSLLAVVRDKHATLRIALDSISTNVQAESLPPALAPMVPKHAVLLDIDHVHYKGPNRDEDPNAVFAVSPGHFRDFLRESWERNRVIAATLERLLKVSRAK